MLGLDRHHPVPGIVTRPRAVQRAAQLAGHGGDRARGWPPGDRHNLSRIQVRPEEIELAAGLQVRLVTNRVVQECGHTDASDDATGDLSRQLGHRDLATDKLNLHRHVARLEGLPLHAGRVKLDRPGGRRDRTVKAARHAETSAPGRRRHPSGQLVQIDVHPVAQRDGGRLVSEREVTVEPQSAFRGDSVEVVDDERRPVECQ